jgi:uncharacterized damage-inducible protein DinB
MGLTLTAEEMLAYTDGEREKWDDWFASHPAEVLDAVVQPQTYSTVWRMMEHIFLVERRHVERLNSAPALTASTGVREPDLAALFHFASAARADLRAFILRLTPAEATRPRVFTVRDRPYQLTPRKLVFHIFLHEIRHWAQIALAVRNAGFAPPGDHDLFFSPALD